MLLLVARRLVLTLILIALLPLPFPLVLMMVMADRNQDTKEIKLSVLNSTLPIVDEGKTSFIPGSSKRLTEHLLRQHNPHAPPDGLIDVHYELELVHILGIDELKQTMTALKWTDPSLAWNATEFGGLDKTWLSLPRLWLPDIIIFNMLQHEDLLGSVRAPGIIHSNGTIECSHPAVYTVSCEINIKHFPLDDQRCSMEIASWAYGNEKIRLHAHIEHTLQHYSPNEEWKLLNVSVHEEQYDHEGIMVSEIRYDIAVKRKPLFYMVTLTFPSYVMCAISIVGLFARFSTTGEREERFTLGVTAILTMAVLSLVVSEKVPHSSTSVPLLVAYFLFNMVVVSTAAVTTGLVMRVHRKGRYGDQPPRWLTRIFCITRHQRRRKPLPGSNSLLGSPIANHAPATSTGGGGGGEWSRKITVVESFIKRLIDACETIQVEMDNAEMPTGSRGRLQTRRENETNGYVQLSERLDWIFMTFFLTAVTAPVIALVMMM